MRAVASGGSGTHVATVTEASGMSSTNATTASARFISVPSRSPSHKQNEVGEDHEMHEEGATGAVGRTTSVGDRTRTCGTSRDSPPLRSSARRNPIDTVCDGVACSDTRLTVRDPRYRRPRTPYLCGRRERVPAIARRQPPIGPGPSSRTARLDHSTTRRDAGERSASANASACGAARSPLADFDLTPTRHVSASW